MSQQKFVLAAVIIAVLVCMMLWYYTTKEIKTKYRQLSMVVLAAGVILVWLMYNNWKIEKTDDTDDIRKLNSQNQMMATAVIACLMVFATAVASFQKCGA